MKDPDWLVQARAEGRITEKGVKMPALERPISRGVLGVMSRPVPDSAYTDHVDVPVPPSTNNLYLNTKRGRVKSAEYREWQAASAALTMMLRPLGPGPFRITYTLMGGADLNMGRDLGNIEKPLTDLLVSTKRICNDSLRAGLHEITLRYVECGEGASFVRIETRSLK